MNTEELSSLFGWMTILNSAFLLYWWIVISFFKKAVFKLHRKWFPLKDEQFSAIHYSGMALFKLLVISLNATPWFALHIISG